MRVEAVSLRMLSTDAGSGDDEGAAGVALAFLNRGWKSSSASEAEEFLRFREEGSGEVEEGVVCWSDIAADCRLLAMALVLGSNVC